MKTQILGLAGAAAMLALALSATYATAQPTPQLEKRWLYVSDNLYVDENVAKLEALLTRARDAGYNGVLFTDYKSYTWWKLDAPERWKANAQRLRALTRDLGLELTVCVFPFGYAGALLYHDPNLASGMPVRDAPLVAHDGALVPVPTAGIENGSFEQYTGHKAAAFGLQDDIGKSSFIDTAVVKEGRASIRFENVGRVNAYGNGRVSQQIAVRPWQQYRYRAWMKCEDLTAGQIQLLVLGGGRTLQYQFPQARVGGRLVSAGAPRNLTTDWVEQSVTFNSLDNTQVTVYAGVWGAKDGSIWWDDLRVEDAPLMNLLRRDTLPLRIAGEDGTVYTEGVDFAPAVVPGMGVKPWPGSYDTHHNPPVIRLLPGTRIREGQALRLGCYHTALVYDAQVNCSLEDPAVFALCAEQMRRSTEALAPDAFFMSHDEIRTGGWEPGETARFKTSGELLAYNIRECYGIAAREGGGKPVYVWSDMFDPNHNARENFYLVNNTLEGSWEGLDPNVIVMKWGGGERARPGLEFFAGRGHKQMIAAYYDSDVAANHQMWTEAMQGVPNVVGVMYTTWRSDYTQLEKFAETWWGGK